MENKERWEENDVYFLSSVPFYVTETITNHKITVTATIQLLISVYMVISTVATATYIPLEQTSHLPKFYLKCFGFMYFKELCPCFLQNFDQDAICTGVSQAIKTWHIWQCTHFDFPTVGRVIYRSKTAISNPLTRRRDVLICDYRVWTENVMDGEWLCQ